MGFENRSAAFLAVGLAVGLVLGLALSPFWPSVPLHASATHGHETFAIATGAVDERMEAIFFLDFLTGDLKAAVLQPQLGKFNAFFSYNVLQDFGSAATKNPKFLMVTGVIDMPQARQNFQFGKCVVYIAEANTGQVACYALPWKPGMQAARRVQNGTFVPLDKRQFRVAAIRGE